MERFIKMQKFSLIHDYYLYMDHNDYVADSLFIQEKLRVKFTKEYAKPGVKYVFLIVSVPKKEVAKFKRAISKMENAMLLKGHSDYPDVYEKYWVNGVGKHQRIA